MELNQIGEFGLIDLIKEDTIYTPGSVIIGIGDDAAVLLPKPQQLQLLTTDMLVENVHFNLSTTTPSQLGYKAIAVSLSDIAAMGGTPRHAVISIALTRQLPVDFMINLYQGMKEICQEFGVNIVGGDTVSSPHSLVINVAVLGEVEPAKLQRRSGAQLGQLVAVTNTLGNSGAGLDLLSKGDWEEYDFAWPLVSDHLTPRPQVKCGQILAAMGTASMNDISDGLASEVNEIAVASKVGMRIYAANIPLSLELQAAAGILGKKALDYALYGGEDYQLLFTVDSGKFSELAAANAGIKLTVIGEVVDSTEGVILVDEDGQRSVLQPKGYNHFR
ncbi:MAG TPA: thiamine-phosphate kinase [Negativicutes bacterium]|jgi:thiamine-monophosphate kinase